ncbi:MAG TPA: hypothetical protein VKP14_10160 [Gaiellaceae bacterium]|nr:hypothetical protein [Gaiellaceae bacterium]
MSKPKMLWIVATGDPVPREEAPRRYVTKEAPVGVIWSWYYQRRIATGELREVSKPAEAPAAVNPKSEAK